MDDEVCEEANAAQHNAKSLIWARSCGSEKLGSVGGNRDWSRVLIETFEPSGGLYCVLERESRICSDNLQQKSSMIKNILKKKYLKRLKNSIQSDTTIHIFI